MDYLLTLFSGENLYIFIALIVLLFMLFLELKFPARIYNKDIKKRTYLNNLFILITNNIILTVLGISTVYLISNTFKLHDFWSNFNLYIQIIFGVLILDFLIWFWHLLNHKVKFLWFFHSCHHSEVYLNSSSAFRFHLGELLLSVLYKSFFLVILGIPFFVFLLNEALITIFAIFHHSNIRLSDNVEKSVDIITITPRVHRTHHSTIKGEHDNNYGVVFSWWDKIFKTRLNKRPDEIGLSYLKEQGYMDFLLLPFKKMPTKKQ